LVPLGCCGSWLFILSYLPLVFGNGVSVFMIKYSNILSYVGLIIISLVTLISIVRLYKDLKVKKNKILEDERKENEISDFRGKLFHG
jgi:membrane protein DedA with SNARE-associated domain